MIKKKNKIAIYTAIFGDYDKLIIPNEKIEGCDFYCFTDNKNLKSDFYEIINAESEFSDPTRNARKIKTLSHKYLPEYEYVLWIDANIVFRNFDVREMFDEFLANHDIAIHKHSVRNCVYDEFAVCVDLGVDSPSLMTTQIVRYIKEGYPIQNGLAETSVVFRKNTERVRKINNDWWNEIKSGSRRDQLSIDYVVWKNKDKYFRIDDSVRNGKYFYVENHKKDSYAERRKKLELNNLEKIILEIENKNCKKCYKNIEIKTLRENIDKRDALIAIMRNSVFWKMRGIYIKIKRILISPFKKR